MLLNDDKTLVLVTQCQCSFYFDVKYWSCSFARQKYGTVCDEYSRKDLFTQTGSACEINVQWNRVLQAILKWNHFRFAWKFSRKPTPFFKRFRFHLTENSGTILLWESNVPSLERAVFMILRPFAAFLEKGWCVCVVESPSSVLSSKVTDAIVNSHVRQENWEKKVS